MKQDKTGRAFTNYSLWEVFLVFGKSRKNSVRTNWINGGPPPTQLLPLDFCAQYFSTHLEVELHFRFFSSNVAVNPRNVGFTCI